MRLELDAGNSRVKWRLKSCNGKVIEQGQDLKQDRTFVKPLQDVEMPVLLSSVEPIQTKWVQSNYNQVSVAVTQSQTLGLKNSYKDPSKMGVDRWLAMLAVYRSKMANKHIVVDAGTAITLDVIDGDAHTGGYICPGLFVMKGALLGQTQTVFAHQDWQYERRFGNDTQSCLDHGLLDMVCSWIERHCFDQTDTLVWLTGGDAKVIAPLLDVQVVFETDLVLNGLTEYFNQ